MTRVVSLFLPTLSTDRVRRKSGDAAPPAEAPLVLVGRDGRRRVVLAADAAAHAAGLRVGMPATKAHVLVPGLIIEDADPVADAEALDRLALWMLQRFAPIVAPDPPDGIAIDSTGADHLHGGEAAMLAALVDRLAGVGIRARGAVADTWGAAHGLARYAARPAFISAPGAAAAGAGRVSHTSEAPAAPFPPAPGGRPRRRGTGRCRVRRCGRGVGGRGQRASSKYAATGRVAP